MTAQLECTGKSVPQRKADRQPRPLQHQAARKTHQPEKPALLPKKVRRPVPKARPKTATPSPVPDTAKAAATASPVADAPKADTIIPRTLDDPMVHQALRSQTAFLDNELFPLDVLLQPARLHNLMAIITRQNRPALLLSPSWPWRPELPAIGWYSHHPRKPSHTKSETRPRPP
jgi:hypothetical protein